MKTKTLFTIPDQGHEKTPFDKLHFWAYLLKTLQDNDNKMPSWRWMDNVKTYLEAEGFDPEKHKLSSEAVTMTRYTFEAFFRTHGTPKQITD